MAESRRIVVFRIGQLGDILVSIPALMAIRRHFADWHIGVVSDSHPTKGYVGAADVLRGSGLVDSFIQYHAPALRGVGGVGQVTALMWRLRAGGYDTLIYLAPSRRSRVQVRRDRLAFTLAGIRHVIGMEGLQPLPSRVEGGALPVVPRESDLLLDRLAHAGIPTTDLPCSDTSLSIGERETAGVSRWLGSLPPDGGRRWIAVSPASNMPIKRWPVDRYEEVVRELISAYDLWPVVFGGPEDCELGEHLVAQWGRGYVAAGQLSVRESLAVISRCVLYLGNDTGVMHMAAVMGVRCVALFTARDYPGNWYPCGEGHVVLCNRMPCEGCMKMVDCEHGRKCILSVGVEQVLGACGRLLGAGSLGPAAMSRCAWSGRHMRRRGGPGWKGGPSDEGCHEGRRSDR